MKKLGFVLFLVLYSVAVNADSPQEMLFEKANGLIEKKEYEKAVDLYSHLLESTNDPINRRIILKMRAQAEVQWGKPSKEFIVRTHHFERAEKDISEAIKITNAILDEQEKNKEELDQKEIEILFKLLFLRANLRDDIQDGIGMFNDLQEVVAIHRGFLPAHLKLAFLYFRMGDWEKGIATIGFITCPEDVQEKTGHRLTEERFRKMYPKVTAEAQAVAAEFVYGSGEFKQAIEMAKIALKYDKENARAYFIKGKAECKLYETYVGKDPIWKKYYADWLETTKQWQALKDSSPGIGLFDVKKGNFGKMNRVFLLKDKVPKYLQRLKKHLKEMEDKARKEDGK